MEQLHFAYMLAGDTLDGQFTLLERIGRGGMGEVFRARYHASGEQVAIKVVSRSVLSELLMARLEREAQAASAISSRHIPRVLAIGKTSEGEVYLVMQLLVGQSLSERMKRPGKRLNWSEIHRIGEGILGGLRDAHAAGVVHRDLKPGNVFLETDEAGEIVAKILDFGVCKYDVHDAEKLTITGESVGTIAYMAPEQIRGASRVDGRADLYSFAMVVFEMITGRMPFDVQGQMALLASKLERAARRLSDVYEGPLPPGLDDLIALTLARDPDLRPSTASEMLAFWRSLGDYEGETVQMPGGFGDAAGMNRETVPGEVGPVAGANTFVPVDRTVRMDGSPAIPAGEDFESARQALSHPPTPVAISSSTAPRARVGNHRATALVAILSASLTGAAAIALLWPHLRGHASTPASSSAEEAEEAPTPASTVEQMMPVTRDDIEHDHGIKIEPPPVVVPPPVVQPRPPSTSISPSLPVTQARAPATSTSIAKAEPPSHPAANPEPRVVAPEPRKRPTAAPQSKAPAIVEKPRY